MRRGGEVLRLEMLILLTHQKLILNVELICLVSQILIGNLQFVNLPLKQLLRCEVWNLVIKLRHMKGQNEMNKRCAPDDFFFSP